MAVARFKAAGADVVVRQVHAPKRADLKYWWKECRKGIPSLPAWDERFRSIAWVDALQIMFSTEHWTLHIDRKGRLK